MPPKTNTDKIDDLVRTVEALSTRLDELEKEANRTREQKEAIRSQLSDHAIKLSSMEKQVPGPRELPDIREQLAVVKSQVEDLRKDREEWGRRLWLLLPPIAAAIAGVVAGYFLKR